MNKIEDFEYWKLIRSYVAPNEPLKNWVNEDNYVNVYISDWNAIREVVDKLNEEDSYIYDGFDYHIDQLKDNLFYANKLIVFKNLVFIIKKINEQEQN